MDQMKIGGFIAERRKAKGWTQSALAEKLGVSDKAVSKWETGKSMPDYTPQAIVRTIGYFAERAVLRRRNQCGKPAGKKPIRYCWM